MAILSEFINIRDGHSNRKFYVDILAIAFGISSWIRCGSSDSFTNSRIPNLRIFQIDIFFDFFLNWEN